VSCATTPAEALLECSSRRIVLTDVVQRGRRVHLLGVADRRFAGRRVDLRFVGMRAGDPGRHVAFATVGADGGFRATAPLPPRTVRATNAARYQAVLGDERSLRLKLFRRMLVDDARSAKGSVTLTGRILPPLHPRSMTIVVKQRVSCTSTVEVGRTQARPDGRFRVTLPGPPETRTATYRLQTVVRESPRNPRLYPTFTLPRAVELR
jgi:hypothetical protein